MRAEAAPDAQEYAELKCFSNFSFQYGASSAEELFERAAYLGYSALAITDECSMAGIVRALGAAERHGVKLIVGTTVLLADGPQLTLLATCQQGYSDLCRLITAGRQRSEKGSYLLRRDDVDQLGSGVLALWTPSEDELCAADEGAAARWLVEVFGERLWIAAALHHSHDNHARLARLQQLGHNHNLPLVAVGDVLMHVRRRRALHDVLTATRLRCTVAQAGYALLPSGERHLRRIDTLMQTYPAALIEQTLLIARRCHFDLRQLQYDYPHELVPAGMTAATWLRQLTFDGARRHWPGGIPAKVRTQLEHELQLIAELRYEHFFLTVADIVHWARMQVPPILCQGRGSSANSAVCFCLGITAINPEHGNLLFERFISRERNEPPDIDVDFEHERREEVIQYIYGKYGRQRAAIAATVICYRRRSALRDVGRALGLEEEQIVQASHAYAQSHDTDSLHRQLRQRGLDPHSKLWHQLVTLVEELRGFPRHLSQHVGGFVISEQPLHHLVPVENAAMPGRTIIQWDKDDLEALCLLKVDCLALGMLTCLRKSLQLLHAHGGPELTLATLPHDDAATWTMIGKADTVGLFQVESRAQMAMLPRLQPRTMHDLAVQIAIIRPGPIVGGMVHPYLARRDGTEPMPELRPELAAVLGRTYGVPIFQEQVMRVVEIAAGFTPGEADQLRRAMAAWKRRGGLEPFRERIFTGMARNGYTAEYTEAIFEQIKGFGEYGFPESHAASFALLAYASAWLKCHHPAIFLCALLNSQPMGFYQPSQLIQDARRHGVKVLPVDVLHSDWECTLHGDVDDPPSLRLGLSRIRGLGKATALRIRQARGERSFSSLDDLVHRARLSRAECTRLADADALRSLAGHRHQARWDSAAVEHGVADDLFSGHRSPGKVSEPAVQLAPPSLHSDIISDYRSQGLSLKGHPLALLRGQLRDQGYLCATQALQPGNVDRYIRYAGLVTVRQRPATANGVVFITAEDETGSINVIVWPQLGERQPAVMREARLLGIHGTLQAGKGTHHLVAKELFDLSGLLPELRFESRDFH